MSTTFIHAGKTLIYARAYRDSLGPPATDAPHRVEPLLRQKEMPLGTCSPERLPRVTAGIARTGARPPATHVDLDRPYRSLFDLLSSLATLSDARKCRESALPCNKSCGTDQALPLNSGLLRGCLHQWSSCKCGTSLAVLRGDVSAGESAGKSAKTWRHRRFI
jgi:hypothetical protein